MRLERNYRILETRGTPLERLLDNRSSAVREEVAAGTHFDKYHFQGLNIILVDAGRTTYQIGNQTCPLVPGSLLVAASGVSYDQMILNSESCHYTYLILSGNLAENWPVPFPAAASFWFLGRTPERMAQLVRSLVDGALEQPHGWALRFGEELFGFMRLLQDAVRQEDQALSLQQQVERLVDRHPEAKWSMTELARRLGMAESTFAHRFRREYGQSPARFISAYKMGHARALLRQGHTAAEVASLLGFASACHFSAVFRRHNGRPPAEFKVRTSAPVRRR